MKIHTIILSILIIVIYGNSYGQKDTTIHTIPIYWTFELGSSYLTSTKIIENRKAPFYPTASGSIYFNWDIPLRNTHTISRAGFSIAPGIGLGASTFSINRKLIENNGLIIIENIVGPYEYSYVQGIYFDIPIDFRYLTPPNSKKQNFSFEIGSKVGRLVYTEQKIFIKEKDESYTRKTQNIGIMNKFRYGINAKISYRKIHINRHNDALGLSFSIIGNYYLSDAFIRQSNIASKSFSIGAGLGFIFN